MIKQIQLYDSVGNAHALEDALRAQEAYDRKEKPAKPSLAASIGDPSYHLHHVRERQLMIEKSESDLNTLIGEGYQIIAQYSIESVGVQLILYKPDEAPKPDEWPVCNQCGGWHDPAFDCGGHMTQTLKLHWPPTNFARLMRYGR